MLYIKLGEIANPKTSPHYPAARIARRVFEWSPLCARACCCTAARSCFGGEFTIVRRHLL